jgi:DNA-binding NarL/FixJ family response regulator
MQDTKQTPLFIAHNHEIFLNGLCHGLIGEGYVVSKQVASGIDALYYILKKHPSIVILAERLSFLSAFDIIKTVQEKEVTTKFIIIASQINYQFVSLERSLNVYGLIHIGDSFKDVQECINQVALGKTYYSAFFKVKNEIHDKQDYLKTLSSVEVFVLSQIAESNNSATIAKLLNLSERTIEKHRSNIISKLNLDKKVNSLIHWAVVNKTLIKTFQLRSTT